jgi:hypothetical protein
VRARVLLAHVVAVVRRHHRDPVAVREVLEDRVEAPLLGQAVVLELDEVVVAEELQVAPQHLLAGFGTDVEDRARQLRAQAAGEGDHALVVLLEQLEVDARLHVEALEERPARELAQVAVAGHVLREERQVEVPAVEFALGAPLLEARAGGHVRLEPDDRLDAGGGGGLGELDRTVHVAVVGHGDRRVARRDLLDPLHQVLDPRRPVEEAVRGVLVEVGETGGGPASMAARYRGLPTASSCPFGAVRDASSCRARVDKTGARRGTFLGLGAVAKW